MPWISPHNCHEKRPRREPDITRRKCCEKLAATRHIRSLFGKMRKTAVCSAVDRKSQATSPRAGPPPSRLGWGWGWAEGLVRWFQRPTWLPASERRERAGGPGFSCRARRRESHPPDVCATSTEAEARAGCIYSQRLWPGRGGAAVRCRLPGPLCPVPAPTQARRMGRLKDEIPLSTSIYAQKYTPWAYIFEPLLDLLPRRGRQPGARGRAARPPARPHSNPLHPPQLTKANHWVCN